MVMKYVHKVYFVTWEEGTCSTREFNKQRVVPTKDSMIERNDPMEHPDAALRETS